MRNSGMVTASRIALARTALRTVPLNRALALAQWTGTSRELTTTGALRPVVAVEACRMLGIDLPSGKLRSAKDVPELDQAWAVALAADLVLATAGRASAPPGIAGLGTVPNRADESTELDHDLADRAGLASPCGARTVLGFPHDACGQCLTVLHELSQADGPMELMDLALAVLDPAFDADPTDWADHAVATVRELAEFEAVASGPGRSAGGTVTLNPLGKHLAEAVFGSISPPAADTAQDLVTVVPGMPPAVALTAAGPWLAARAPHAAVRELLEFAAAFDGPLLRSVALEIARRSGADAMPVWREYARMPGFGAYARQWLATRDEAVAADDKDEAWLLVDTIMQSSGQLTPEMLPLLSGTVLTAAGDSAAEALAGIANCGHPHAADVTRMLSGGPAAGFRTAAEKGTLYQLKVTLRGVSKPPVWRRVLVHADASLGELHRVIIAAMGWDGGHLHMFSDSIAQYGPGGEDEDEDEFALADVLVEPGGRLRYTYDCG